MNLTSALTIPNLFALLFFIAGVTLYFKGRSASVPIVLFSGVVALVAFGDPNVLKIVFGPKGVTVEKRGPSESVQEKASQAADAQVAARPENQNSKYTVLVFYKPLREADARDISQSLIGAGFRSSTAQTTLSEVVSQTGAQKPGTIYLAVRAHSLPIISEVQRILTSHPRSTCNFYLDPDDWRFQYGDVQIYLF